MNDTSPNNRAPMRGVGMTVVATAFFATLDTSMQYVAHAFPVVMALWVRYLIQVVFTSAAIFKIEHRLIPRANQPNLQILRGSMFVLTNILAYMSLRYIPAGEFTAILMLTPVLVSVTAAILFGEKVKPVRWLLLLMSFLGTMLIVKPGSHGLAWYFMFPIGALLTNSCFLIVTASLSSKDSPMSTHFYSGLFGVVVLGLILPWHWNTEALNITLWSVLFLGGLAASCGHMLLLSAYKNASSTVLTPFLYTQLVFVSLGGWLVFHKTVDAWSIIGMALIGVGGATGAWLTQKTRE